jgi:predicted esterase
MRSLALIVIPMIIATSITTTAGGAPPPVTSGAPAAGKRVKVTAPEYAGTEVYHALYLPSNWEPGGTYPVIVEFAPNQCCSFSGNVEDTHLGYYQSGGVDFIWVTMPMIQYTVSPPANATTWWGNGNADDPTGQALCAAYTITNLVRILENYGGDPSSVFITGFSRGAIAGGYIGRSTDELADIWLGFLPHSHTDAGWFDAAGDTRTDRVRGRASFVTYGEFDDAGNATVSSKEGVDSLKARGFPVESHEIAGTDHTDEWITDAATPVASSASYTGHAPVPDVRARMRTWMSEVIANKPGTHSIRGGVTDASGAPIAGVRVQSGLTHWTFTDATGAYKLAGLLDGGRTVTVSHPGYQWSPDTVNVTLAGADLAGQDFGASPVTTGRPGTLIYGR